ncbi:complement component C1q receptor [Ambystoma mexicanum]|uniref:complement component C1q receptor n=1 Tax=Ambystoma mexicanum TaxID=8296 RepID=UPI0037E732C0
MQATDRSYWKCKRQPFAPRALESRPDPGLLLLLHCVEAVGWWGEQGGMERRLLLLWCHALCLCRAMGITTAVESEVLCATNACYTVHLDSSKDFQAARQACAINGGHLATVKSPEEDQHLQALLQKLPESVLVSGALKLWIGLSLEKKECYQKYKPLRGFSWITSRGKAEEEESQFSKWMDEPMQTCTMNRCVSMNVFLESPQNFKWSDGKCLTPVKGYICKFSFRGMCRQVALAGPGVVVYAMPFGFTSTSLKLVPFATGATVRCDSQQKPDTTFLFCNDNSEKGFDWNRSGPFCVSTNHGCSYNNGGCEQDCSVNADSDSISCGCRTGYELLPDMVTCALIDHCKPSPCQQTCTSLQSGYECSCYEGHILAQNKKDCIDVDECLQHPCEQVCTNSPGSFSCSCLMGFEAMGKACQDLDECWQGNPCAQGCINTNGSYTCYCKEGYVKGEEATTCVDVDECQKKPCEDLCHNTPGSYECACGEGLVLAPDGISCMFTNTNTEAVISPKDEIDTQTPTPALTNRYSKPDKVIKSGWDETIHGSPLPSTIMPALALSSNDTDSVANIIHASQGSNKMLLFSVVAAVIVVLLLLALALGVFLFRRKATKKESKTTPGNATDKYCWEESGNKAMNNEYR